MSTILVRGVLVDELGQRLHEAWNAPRPDNSAHAKGKEPRKKPVDSRDSEWIAWALRTYGESPGGLQPVSRTPDGGWEVDIANLDFRFFPKAQKLANIIAAQRLIQRVLHVGLGSRDIELLSDVTHDDWVADNYKWADKELLVEFNNLTPEEADKDRALVVETMRVINELFECVADAATGRHPRHPQTPNIAAVIGVVQGELPFAMASALHAIWRKVVWERSAEEGKAEADRHRWVPTKDESWFGKALRDPRMRQFARLESFPIDPDDQQLPGEKQYFEAIPCADILRLEYEELPHDWKSDNLVLAKMLIDKAVERYSDNVEIDDATIEQFTPEMHESGRVVRRRTGLPIRASYDQPYEGLDEPSRVLMREMVEEGLQTMHGFMLGIADFRIGYVAFGADFGRYLQESVAAAMAAVSNERVISIAS